MFIKLCFALQTGTHRRQIRYQQVLFTHKQLTGCDALTLSWLRRKVGGKWSRESPDPHAGLQEFTCGGYDLRQSG